MAQPTPTTMAISQASQLPEAQGRLQSGHGNPCAMSSPEEISTFSLETKPGIMPRPPTVAPSSARAAPPRGRRFLIDDAFQTAPRDLNAAQSSSRGWSADTAQSRLNARFAGVKPSDFGDPGIFVHTALDLNPPPAFGEVWIRIDTRELEAIFTKDHRTAVHNQRCILILGDAHDEERMSYICKLAELLDRMKDGCPPIIFAQHTNTFEKQGVSPSLGAYDDLLKSGVDDIVTGEPKGIMFVVALRSRLDKIFSISDKILSIMDDQRELNARAFHYEERLKFVVWDYLRRRLQTGLPPQERDCLPGIPSALNDFSLGPRLGKGASGEVFPLVTPGTDPSTQVVKCISKANITHIRGLKSLKHQIKLLKMMSTDCPHDNIVKFYQVYHLDTHILFRMENGGSMNLFKRLMLRESEEENWPMPSKKVQAVIEQSSGAVAHLHVCQVAHRDVKPENVCLKETADGLTVKLCDFDIAIQCAHNQKVSGICGTFPFIAPEVLLQKSYSPFPSDVWSLGIMYAEVLCGLHLLERVLHLSAQRSLFEQDNTPQSRRDERATKKFLTRKINDYFQKRKSASNMVECWGRGDLRHLVMELAGTFDSILVEAPQRSTANDLMYQFARVMYNNDAHGQSFSVAEFQP